MPYCEKRHQETNETVPLRYLLVRDDRMLFIHYICGGEVVNNNVLLAHRRGKNR